MELYQSATYREDLETTVEHIVNAENLYGSTVLVTGATGTIGSFVVDALLGMNRSRGANIQVIVAGRNTERLRTRFAWAGGELLTCVHYDIYQPIEFDLPVEYVIHAAGNATPGAFAKDPVGTIVGNVQGTYALLAYGKTHGMKRFLYVSSGEVYGTGNAEMEALREDYSGPLEATSPRSCYPSSKRTAETLCVSYAQQFDTQAVIVRPCHTYGPGMTESDNRAHAQFFRNALKQEDIVLKSAGKQLRSYCYVADCVSGLLTVLLCGENANAYNLANPEARVTIAQLAQEIASAAGTKAVFAAATEVDIAQRSPIAKQVLATDKLEALGWKGAYCVHRGVNRTIKILQEVTK